MIREVLNVLGLRKYVRALKRKIMSYEVPFTSCTPHLLIAVNHSLQWLQKNNLLNDSDYMEFGIFRGFTFWYAQALAKDIGALNMSFYGFDSFQGLPDMNNEENWGPFQKGAYCCYRKDVEDKLNSYGVEWNRTHLIEGWFDETLKTETRIRFPMKKCSLCVIDADLYSSTKLALEFIAPLIKDKTIILFDDWYAYNNDPSKGEQKAYQEFLQNHQEFTSKAFLEIAAHGKGFLVERTSNSNL